MRRIYFLSDLPDTVKGIACETETGYIIAINARLPIEVQAQTIRHEIAHIALEHFKQLARPLEVLEHEAGQWARGQEH